jgi:hypothetical protein
MRTNNFKVIDSIADNTTKKFLGKIPKFPTEVIILRITIPPTADDYIVLEYSGAREVLRSLWNDIDTNQLKKCRIAFLIEYEPNPYFLSPLMEIRMVVVGNLPENIKKSLERNAKSKQFSLLGIESEFSELSNVNENQLNHLVRPYAPDSLHSYNEHQVKVMSYLYQLDIKDLTNEIYPKIGNKQIKQ